MLKFLSLFLINTFIYFEGDIVYSVTFPNGTKSETVYQIREKGVKVFQIGNPSAVIDTSYYYYDHSDSMVIYIQKGYEKAVQVKDNYTLIDSLQEVDSLSKHTYEKRVYTSKPTYAFGGAINYNFELYYDNSTAKYNLKPNSGFNDVIVHGELVPVKGVRTMQENNKKRGKSYLELKSIDINRTPIYFPKYSRIH